LITDFIRRKNEIIAEYEKFLALIKKFDTTIIDIGLPSPLNQIKESLIEADRQVKNIREGRFKLMIVGEAKSGKSTFINAYLGVELLPMDVKQCTSSIIEIKYSPNFKLDATYADGRKEQYCNKKDIINFLNSNAAIDDNYRDIPVPTINQDLLVKFGLSSKNGTADIPEHELNAFLCAPEIRKANIHNINNYNEKITSYIKKRRNNWHNIVVKIEIFYPFKDETFKDIEIIDSPGVCSRGGVAEITTKYIENANAIIFLKPVSGQALESVQFTEFMDTTSVERNKNALFLVLTRATNVSLHDLKKLKEEAFKQFSKLRDDHIIIVDSKAELYANSFLFVEDIKGRIIDLNAKGTIDDFVKGIWFDAEEKKDTFIKNLKKKSNFGEINNVLSTFGRKAHYIALVSLLDVVFKVYTRIIGDLNSHIARFTEKASDPTELAKKIKDIKSELENIINKLHNGIEAVTNKFNGDQGATKKKADDEANNFKRKVEKIPGNEDNSFDSLKKLAFLRIDEYKKLQKSLQEEVVSECNSVLVAITTDNIPFTSLEPEFSETIFEKLKKSTESHGNETREIEEGFTFKTRRTITEYSQRKHFNKYKDSIIVKVDSIKNLLIGNLHNFTNNIIVLYTNKLKENIEAKKVELDKIMEAKLNAEQIKVTIENLNNLLINFESSKCLVEQIKGGITIHVR
jgi:GTPase SAR1 family protein